MVTAREPTWAEIIDRAEKRGYFTTDEDTWAGRWDNCACRDLPRDARYRDGEPVDDELFTLGQDFSVAVNHNDFHRAREIDEEIRRRIRIGEYEVRS